MKTKQVIIEQIKKELRRQGATSGEICAELLRLEKANLNTLSNYLKIIRGAKNEAF